MKHIKEYKIFESIDDISNIKECFLPVIDIVYEDNIGIVTGLSLLRNDMEAVVLIDLKNINDESVYDEILDAIHHCKGYGFFLRSIHITYYTGKSNEVYKEIKMQSFAEIGRNKKTCEENFTNYIPNLKHMDIINIEINFKK